MPYFTTAPTQVEGYGDPVERLKPVPLTGPVDSVSGSPSESAHSIEIPCLSDELDRIAKAMREPGLAPERYCQLYASQQALAWASGQYAAAPCDVVMGGRVQPLMGTLAG